MKVLIFLEDSLEPYDVSPDITVRSLKKMVQKTFLLQLTEDQHAYHYLEMRYCGAALWDNWTLRDICYTSGKTIRCLIKRKPVLYVVNAVARKTVPLDGNPELLRMSVGQLKSIISSESGLPVSVFRLSTDTGEELYNCNNLQDHAVEAGACIHLDTWRGWSEFLQGCLLGDIKRVQKYLSKNHAILRFQQRVALYISASCGHLNLADWLLKRRVHAEEPVGVHPCRQWCHRTSHIDTGKCPIHEAAAKNRLHIVKLFINKSFLALMCKDPRGCDPLKIAIMHGHKDCVKYLANKLFSVVPLPHLSLPMHIYIKMKQWIITCQRTVASRRCHYKCTSQTEMCELLLIDGFNKEKMFLQSRGTNANPQRLYNISHSPIYITMGLHLVKQRKEVEPGRGGVKLPPLNTGKGQDVTALHRKIIPTGQLSHADMCCRQNAASSLALARTFTEMPWSKQLRIARTLLIQHLQGDTCYCELQTSYAETKRKVCRS